MVEGCVQALQRLWILSPEELNHSADAAAKSTNHSLSALEHLDVAQQTSSLAPLIGRRFDVEEALVISKFALSAIRREEELPARSQNVELRHDLIS